MSDRFRQLYQRFNWTSWQYPAGNLRSLKRAEPPIPPRYGIYLFRAPSTLARVRGSSDVIYIGQSGGGPRRGSQGIGPGNGGPGRLFNTRGHDKRVREMIEAIFPDGIFLVQCVFFDDVDPRTIEAQLLVAYLEDHCELPPANHSNVTNANPSFAS